MKRILLFAFAILAGSPLLLAQAQRHFMTDAAYRQKVEKVFNEKMKQVGKQFFDTKNQTVSLEEKEALTFLYAYMATADVTDYTTSFYLKNVRSSFATREQMAWGRNVPEASRIFFTEK